MTLEQLSAGDKTVLLALVGLMARTDGEVSAEELALLEQIADELGAEEFERVRDAAALLADSAAIVAAAGTVVNPQSRELIYELVYDIAIKGTIAASEGELLDRLAAIWDLPGRSRF